jgi:Coenzyme PQQ synthesis protein D (PqqD)
VKLDASRYTWRRVDDKLVVLDLVGASYFSISDSGSALWERLTEGASFEVLVDDLCERFEIDRAQAATDVETFLGTLREFGVLTD